MPEVLDYRSNLMAKQRWGKMDTGEEVIARHNGLPITRADLMDTAPCEYVAEDDSA